MYPRPLSGGPLCRHLAAKFQREPQIKTRKEYQVLLFTFHPAVAPFLPLRLTLYKYPRPRPLRRTALAANIVSHRSTCAIRTSLYAKNVNPHRLSGRSFCRRFRATRTANKYQVQGFLVHMWHSFCPCCRRCMNIRAN